MRIAVGLVACITAGIATLTLAADPLASQAGAPATPAVSPPPKEATPQAAPAAAAASQPTVAAKSATTRTVDPDVRQLLSQGYKQQTRHGQVLYCKREPVIGSRVEKVELCGTVEELRLRTQSSREMTEHAQRTQVNPTTH